MKKFIFWVAYILGLNSLFFFWNKDKLLILLYHGVTEDFGSSRDTDYRGKHIPKSQFEKQVAYLKKHFNILSLSDAIKQLQSGSLPPKSAVITFDDGYLDNYTVMFPILSSLGIPATIFPVTDFVEKKILLWVDVLEYAIKHANASSVILKVAGRRTEFSLASPEDRNKTDASLRYLLKNVTNQERVVVMDALLKQVCIDKEKVNSIDLYHSFDWNHVREMHASGIEFGGHTKTHPILSQLDNKNLHQEIFESTEELKKNIKGGVEIFAYPNGQKNDYSSDVITVLRQAGYKSALTTIFGFNTVQTNAFELKRMTVDRSEFWPFFIATLSGFRLFLQKMGDYIR